MPFGLKRIRNLKKKSKGKMLMLINFQNPFSIWNVQVIKLAVKQFDHTLE